MPAAPCLNRRLNNAIFTLKIGNVDASPRLELQAQIPEHAHGPPLSEFQLLQLATALLHGPPKPRRNAQLIDSQLILREAIKLIAQANIRSLVNACEHGREQKLLIIGTKAGCSII